MAKPRSISAQATSQKSRGAKLLPGLPNGSRNNTSAALTSADKPLTDMQRNFARYWGQGETKINAATKAGYAANSVDMVYRLARMPAVLAIYNEEKRLFQEAAQISRKDVLDGMKEAIEMGKLMAEPHAVIAGWREIGKILGYYATVSTQINVNHTGTVLIDRMNKMSDAELLALVMEGQPGDTNPLLGLESE